MGDRAARGGWSRGGAGKNWSRRRRRRCNCDTAAANVAAADVAAARVVCNLQQAMRHVAEVGPTHLEGLELLVLALSRPQILAHGLLVLLGVDRHSSCIVIEPSTRRGRSFSSKKEVRRENWLLSLGSFFSEPPFDPIKGPSPKQMANFASSKKRRKGMVSAGRPPLYDR